MEATLERLNAIFCDVFGDDELVVRPETTAKDVEGWDSLMHVSLVVNVEKAFGVRFLSAEVARLTNVGDLIALIEKHLLSKESG